jgi:ribosome recycling factor
MCEERKIVTRNIRRESNEMIKELKKEGAIAEDESFRAQDQIQKITDEYINLIDDAYKKKEKEILEF